MPLTDTIKDWIWYDLLGDAPGRIFGLEAIDISAIHPCSYIFNRITILPRNVRTLFYMSKFHPFYNSNIHEYYRPRWLLEKGYTSRAEASLQFLRAAKASDPIVTTELAEIQSSIAEYKLASSLSWTVLFTNRSLFNRLWRAALLQFMAQMCGNTAMKYYLPSIFISLGLGQRMSLMVSGIETTLKIGCTIIEMLVIDKFGRRATLVVGTIVMSFALLVCFCLVIKKFHMLTYLAFQINGVLPQAYPDNVNIVADYVCVIFIFLYTFGYSVSFGPAAWVYGSEVCFTHVLIQFPNVKNAPDLPDQLPGPRS
jgi:hypothetical protein